MTREEAKKELSKLIFELGFEDNVDDKVCALNMAIQALSQEPTVDEMEREYEKSKALFHKIVECDDAISRKDVINAIDKWISEYKPQHYLIQSIRELPSVTQKSESVTEFADRCRECGARYGKLLKQLREQTRWIPVSERLPQKDDLYLICFDDGEYELDYFCIDTFSYSGVVAWMPLPKPYKAESEE